MQTVRRAGAFATILLTISVVVAAVITGRILIFEYFHGSAAAVRHLLRLAFG